MGHLGNVHAMYCHIWVRLKTSVDVGLCNLFLYCCYNERNISDLGKSRRLVSVVHYFANSFLLFIDMVPLVPQSCEKIMRFLFSEVSTLKYVMSFVMNAPFCVDY